MSLLPAHKTRPLDFGAVLLLLLVAVFATEMAAASEPPEVTGKQEKDVTQLQIGVKFKPKRCSVTAHINDRVKVHYRGFLTDGKQFDNTYDLDQPVQFRLGAGSVIKGWENGVLGMCMGEKRKLKVPPHLGYGDEGHVYGIPPGATIIFEVQLVGLEKARKKRARATA
ncbi:hypothetical protein CLOP_g10808 [Closterium sp. NIES-67]|nr:hypothetical protein CLOP_g10808 [Closterium sp. NIES-67]